MVIHGIHDHNTPCNVLNVAKESRCREVTETIHIEKKTLYTLFNKKYDELKEHLETFFADEDNATQKTETLIELLIQEIDAIHKQILIEAHNYKKEKEDDDDDEDEEQQVGLFGNNFWG